MSHKTNQISETSSDSEAIDSSPDQIINNSKTNDKNKSKNDYSDVLDWEIFDEMGLTQSSTYTDSYLDSYSDSYSDSLSNPDPSLKEGSPTETKSRASESSDKRDANKCIHCGDINIVIDTAKGFSVCQSCGIINDNILDQNPEWTNYDEKKGSRCGSASHPLMQNSSLGTSISGRPSRLKMMHTWNQTPYKDRSLLRVFKKIEGICQGAKLPKSVIDTAQIVYYNIRDHIVRGKNRKSLVAACVYYGCQNQLIPRSPKEIADIFGLELTEVTSGCRNLTKLMKSREILDNMQSSETQDFIKRHAKILKIGSDYIKIACDIANNIERLEIATNHQPPSIAAASIMLMCQEHNLNVNRKEISTTFGISEVTISKTCKKIEGYKKAILSNENTEYILKIYREKKNINKSNN